MQTPPDPRSRPPRTLTLYRTLEKVPLGREVFSQVVRLAAPYFRTIPAWIDSAEPGLVVAQMRHAPWVRNHLGGVHAIALCNLAELAMGVVAETTVPPSHRWIPKRMTVEYQARASGRMRAEARLALPDPLPAEGVEVPVAVPVFDGDGTEVFRAEITIWITPRRRG